MHWKVRREFLSRVDIFSNCGRRDLKVLAKTCSEARYEKGQTLCRQGERGVAAFLIVSGRVAVENELENGEILRVAELGQGAIVGELSIIDGAERVSTIRAQGEVEVLVLAQWNLLAVIKSRPTIAAAMLPVIVKRFRETAQELRRRDRDSERARESLYQ